MWQNCTADHFLNQLLVKGRDFSWAWCRLFKTHSLGQRRGLPPSSFAVFVTWRKGSGGAKGACHTGELPGISLVQLLPMSSSGKGENPNHHILCWASLEEARERQGPGERVKEQLFSFWKKHRPLCPTPKIRACWIQFSPAAAAKLLQSCPTLCNPIDGSPPGSPVPGILQASSTLTTMYGRDFITAVSFCKTGLHWLAFLDGQEIMVHLVNRGWLLQGSGGGGEGGW